VPNPIFMDLNPNDDITSIRHEGLVFFAGIVGVPWQDIARNPNDLTLGFKSPDELDQPAFGFGSAWEVILGEPDDYVTPADPFMIESIDPRAGQNPVTGDPIVPPNGSPNEINGSEWTITGRNDLQYACIFDLPPGAERDCALPGHPSCDCTTPSDNPLCCDANDADPRCAGAPDTLQVRAKAYPGIRELSLIRSLGSQGVVGSVCPKQLDDLQSADFGYRPAISALIDRVKTGLGAQCLPRSLVPDSSGQVSCAIIEARNTQGACSCAVAGRQDVQRENEEAVATILADPLAEAAGWDCFCEMVQLQGDELQACQYTVGEPVLVNGQPVHGWCYVDAESSPPVGDPTIVDQCPMNEKRILRFVGQGEAMPGATLYLTCAGEPAL
jgi:hypothetical protein